MTRLLEKVFALDLLTMLCRTFLEWFNLSFHSASQYLSDSNSRSVTWLRMCALVVLEKKNDPEEMSEAFKLKLVEVEIIFHF